MRRSDPSQPAGMPLPRIAALAEHVRGKFRGMPGLCLTEAQARRLWNMEPLVCVAILQALVDTGFLVKTSTGMYRRSRVSSIVGGDSLEYP